MNTFGNWQSDGQNERVTPGNDHTESPACVRKGNLAGVKSGKVGRICRVSAGYGENVGTLTNL